MTAWHEESRVRDMILCEDAEPLFQDYLDGYLLSAQREVLEGHLKGCGQCRDLIGGLSRLDRRLDEVRDFEVPAGLSTAIIAALPAQAYGPSPLRRALVWGAAPVAALALLVAGLFVQGRFPLRGERVAHREVEVSIAAPQASSVAVVGDFNGWDPKRTRLVRTSQEGLWRARLELPPGVYQYSFVLDGKTWVSDPGAKTMLSDGFGGHNSVIIVERTEI